MKYPTNESSRIEFKSTIPKNDQIVNTVIGFCNTLGGKIIIGVNDNGIIEGINEEIAQISLEWLDKMIYETCTPPIIPLVYLQRLDSKVLIIIEVSSGMNKPYYKTAKGLAEGVFVRLGRSTMKANADMIEELKWQSRGMSFDTLPVYKAKVDDLVIENIEYFLTHRRNQKKIKVNEEVLNSYDLIVTEQGQLYPSVAGILMFCTQPQKYLPEAYILCSHFSGNSGREAIASRVIEGNLFEQFDGAYDFILSQLNKSYVIKGKLREEQYEIPTTAIREALMNAILHRNYHIPSPIKIAIYRNRVEFFSPGNFFGPLDLSSLESGITYMRNGAIAKILWESKYVEKMGSGFIEIFESYRQANLVPPEVVEGTNFIKCILPRVKNSNELADDMTKLLNYMKVNESISRSDIIENLNIPRATAGRYLSKLLKAKKIIRIGQGRSSKYTLAH